MKMGLNYVLIRTHAMIADLLTQEQTRRLAEAEGVPDFLDRLAKTPYGRISVEGAARVPIALERAFYGKFIERILRIVDLTPAKIGEFLQAYYYMRFEVLNLKRILRGKFSGLPDDEIRESLVPIEPYLVPSYEWLIGAGSVEEAVGRLEGTPYSGVQGRLGLYEEHEALWPLELGLNHIFANAVFMAVRELPARDRRVVHNIVEFEADIENFLVAVKQRGAPVSELELKEMFPATYGIGLGKLREVIEARGLRPVVEGLGSPYSEVLSHIYAGDVAMIRTQLKRHKYETARLAKAADNFGFNVIMAYLVYSEIEKDNLVGIAWGKTQGLPSEELLKYVVIPRSE